MQTAIFSSDMDTLTYWLDQLGGEIRPIETVEEIVDLNDNAIIIADYDSVANEINRLIQDDRLPRNLCVLERNPNTLIGKKLIRQGIKAYGNSRMLAIHLQQMCETVAGNKIWTYPELTAAMVNDSGQSTSEPNEELLSRLTDKEREVGLLVLEGLTNEGIASRLQITTRTVKAHLSAVFSKLHVNDRLGLVLLLK